MAMPQSVELREITAENAAVLAATAFGVSLGDKQRERQLNSVLGKIQQGKRVFLIDWEGSKVPRGVTIIDQVIGWTQNGMVASADGGGHIGTYIRLVEFGGGSGNHHQMLIYV